MERGQKIQVKTDNTIAYINNMGGTVSLKCYVLAQEISKRCIGIQAWISAEHIPGREKSTTNFMSSELNENTESSLSPAIFLKIMEHYLFQAEIAFFGTYFNKQKPRRASGHLCSRCIQFELVELKFLCFSTIYFD